MTRKRRRKLLAHHRWLHPNPNLLHPNLLSAHGVPLLSPPPPQEHPRPKSSLQLQLCSVLVARRVEHRPLYSNQSLSSCLPSFRHRALRRNHHDRKHRHSFRHLGLEDQVPPHRRVRPHPGQKLRRRWVVRLAGERHLVGVFSTRLPVRVRALRRLRRVRSRPHRLSNLNRRRLSGLCSHPLRLQLPGKVLSRRNKCRRRRRWKLWRRECRGSVRSCLSIWARSWKT